MTQVTAMTWLWTAPKQHYLRITGRGKEGDYTTRSCSMQTGWWREDDHRIWINSHILHGELNLLCTELFAATFCRGKWFFSGGMSQSREHHNESSCCTRYLIIHHYWQLRFLLPFLMLAGWLVDWLQEHSVVDGGLVDDSPLKSMFINHRKFIHHDYSVLQKLFREIGSIRLAVIALILLYSCVPKDQKIWMEL